MSKNRKGGRPPKPDAQRRSETVHFRVTLAQMDMLRSKASQGSLSLSDFARRMVITGKVTTPVSAAELRLIAELTREKNNLNQLAKIQHAAGASAKAEILDRIILFYIDTIAKLKRHDRKDRNG